MKARLVAYWVTTALIASELIAGGLTDMVHGREMLVAGLPVVDVLRQLGYPAYLLAMLGLWKLLAAGAILTPRLPRLKEWAYAGVFFELSGAVFSHVVVEHNFGNAGGPLFLAALALASWALRPQNRVLGVIVPWPSRKPDGPQGSPDTGS